MGTCDPLGAGDQHGAGEGSSAAAGFPESLSEFWKRESRAEGGLAPAGRGWWCLTFCSSTTPLLATVRPPGLAPLAGSPLRTGEGAVPDPRLTPLSVGLSPGVCGSKLERSLAREEPRSRAPVRA